MEGLAHLLNPEFVRLSVQFIHYNFLLVLDLFYAKAQAIFQ